MPCAWHGTDNICKRLTPTKGRLPDKVRDHLFALTRDAMATAGPKAVKDWVDELELLVDASEMPMETAAALRKQYEPLLNKSAKVAAKHANPKVPISNASVENQIASWVDKLTNRRGPTCWATSSSLEPTVPCSTSTRSYRRCVPHPGRTTAGHRRHADLVEPAGTCALRGAAPITELLDQETA